VREELRVGDALDVLAALPPGSIDLVVTDPPYGMGYRSNKRAQWARFDRIANDTDFDAEWTTAWLRHCHRVLRDDSHIYVFCSDHHLGAFRDGVAAAGFTVKRTLVWFKGGGGIGDLEGDYIHETEFIVFAHKGRRPLDGRRRGNVFQVPKIPPGALLHPTQKPAGVIRPLIQKSSRAGDVVLDPFAGSGTTGVVAVEEGRGYVMIEQDPQYIEVAQRRLAQGGLFSEGALP
jgi:site-specific DNA-methyltransferase (adenine-specific)